MDTYYYYDKSTRKKNHVNLILLNFTDNPIFEYIYDCIWSLTKQYFGNHIKVEYKTIFIKIPHDGKYSYDKPVIFNSNNYPIELSSIRSILKNNTKSIKIMLSSMTIKKKGILFDKYENKKNKQITIDVNKYINFNFVFREILVDDSIKMYDIIENIEREYNIDKIDKINKKLLLTINSSSVKNITNSILDCVM